jgi:methylated-DNA-[protein]-cysteine S-methyltransferase
MVARTALQEATTTTPLGRLTIVCSSRGVVATTFDDDERAAIVEDGATAMERVAVRDDGDTATAARATARAAVREAAAYLAGGLRAFTVPADLAIVPDGFGRRVLETVATIPFGELWTYGDVAGMAGAPRAARAAGSALSRCPIELFVPCHRVVRASGTLGGYGRHADRKRWLIRHEGEDRTFH